MAATAVSRVNVPLNELSGAITYSALDGTDGALIDFEGKDGYTLLLFTCTVADTPIIKGGNGAKGISDMTLNLAKDDVKGIIIDSAYFMQVSGENKGKVAVTGKATTSVAAIELKPGR